MPNNENPFRPIRLEWIFLYSKGGMERIIRDFHIVNEYKIIGEV